MVFVFKLWNIFFFFDTFFLTKNLRIRIKIVNQIRITLLIALFSFLKMHKNLAEKGSNVPIGNPQNHFLR
ncbi:hypothetical protein A2645_01975 [Candidatus Nomurabacteria bacterium RIFCSPHIGHO2_01_FULL_39_9]|uniref:Uncharacterized protein n=1 Tax=Candidatus Nomurabacteria bacterium RIFCSPHIGHO2_01_FULL_39_9 TaxID=1801735 RepID=A0A1F6UX09_9BACT|nr:MAG: hypothetical protein A2645_01975 [Candidatus Nomurabacteria bacterium RIFCSPHIGHO2_01_FULL_39_9]